MPTAPELKARVSLDGSAWEAGVRGVQSSLKGLAGSFGEIKNLIASAFTVGAIIQQTRSIIEYGGHIKDLSVRTGISTDALQEFDYAAKQTGTSLDAFVMALRKLAISQIAVLEGNKELEARFKALGASFDDVKSKTPEQLFRQIGEEIRTTDLTSNQLTATIDIMGRSADQVLPAMKEGFADIAAELSKIGGLLDANMIDKLDAMGDSMTRFVASQKTGWAMVAEYAAGAGNIITKAVQFMGLGIAAAGFAVTGQMGRFRGVGEEIIEMIHGVDPRTGQVIEKREKKASGMLGVDLDQLRTKAAGGPAARAERERGERLVSGDMQVNQLQRIGAFVGGPDRLVSLTERSLAALLKIEQNTARNNGSGGVIFPS